VLALFGCGHQHGAAPHATVVAYHQESANAALQILESGGNAFDAFVAATFVDWVVGYGVSTPAGQLGAMLYVAGSDTKIYLDAGYDDLAAGTSWQSGDPAGRAFVVPGAVAGLEALSKKYGRLSFASAIQPAIQVATDGFTIDPDYAYAIQSNAAVLKGAMLTHPSSYANDLFFPGGQPLAAGAVLKQPAVAQFLTDVAQQGAAYLYTGAWAEDCVAAIAAEGGHLTAADLDGYEPQWRTPWQTSYHGYEVFTSSGRTFGGIKELASLKTIESIIGNVTSPLVMPTVGQATYTTYATDLLEILVRTWRAIQSTGCGSPTPLSWMDPTLLDDPNAADQCLSATFGANAWSSIDMSLSASAQATAAPHTFSIAIVDAEGNAIAGTHTIEGTAWGAGIFVDGVVLNASAELAYATNTPDPTGQRRRITPLPMHLVFDGSKLALALALFGASEEPAGFELLVNTLDLKLPLGVATSMPRFGYTETDAMGNTVDLLDWGFDPNAISTLQMRGLDFQQATSETDPVDTGLAAAIQLLDDGTQVGAAAPLRGPPCPSCDNPTVVSY
jgi:gamma-glutamyltranspeptidase/glutathione hydrolase